MSTPDVYAPKEGRFSSRAPVDTTKCRKRIWSGAPAWYSTQCTRKAVLWEEGYGWCKTHAPSTAKAKEDARKAERDRQNRESRYRAKTEQLERDIVTAALEMHRNSNLDTAQEVALVGNLRRACDALEAHLKAEP